MKKSTKLALSLFTGSILGMQFYNILVDHTACKKNYLTPEKGMYYNWKHGKVFYTRIGKGSPILLLHDINSISCSKEWTGVRKLLAKTHTVYTIDLPGCGRSEKPAIQYINFLFVTLLRDFVHDVIKEKTDVVASNYSSSFTLMADQLHNDLFNEIILINPPKLADLELTPPKFASIRQRIFQVPVLGTFLYNISTSKAAIHKTCRNSYFTHIDQEPKNIEGCFYEAAHLFHGDGKYLFSSIRYHYTNAGIRHILMRYKRKVTILASMDLITDRVLETYSSINDNFLIIPISNCGIYPHLENGEEVGELIDDLTF